MSIAAAAATLFIAGCANMGSTPTQTADSGAVKVKCYGANSCKGQAECKTGMNSCKGQGFKDLTATECAKQHGSTTAPAK